MNFGSDPHLDVLQNIEFGLKIEYEKSNELTDKIVISALENSKIAVKKEFGYAKNEKLRIEDCEKGIIDWCIKIGTERINKVNDLSLKEYTAALDKIKRSVSRHEDSTQRGYYNFIRNYV